MRLIQAGEGNPRPLIVCYLVDATILGARIRDAVGPRPCVVSFVEGHAPEAIEATIARAAHEASFDDLAELVLVGYSLGCSGVREVLVRDKGLEHLAGVVAIDGTHASLPPAPWQVETWRTEFDAARSGRLLFVASHTEQTYVEHLPSGQAFTSTVNVLRKVSGWPLDDAGTIDAPVVRGEGNAWIYSYASKTIDGPAHIAQAREALPAILAKHVRPLLEGAADTDPAPPETT